MLRFYEWFFTEHNREQIEGVAVFAGVVGFAIHLALIFLNRQGFFERPVFDLLSRNYLSAVYTPFSCILLAEVLLLVYHIPRSMTESVANLYEIISLIVIRRVFKDIARFERQEIWALDNPDFQRILLDMSGALVLLFLLAFFYRYRHIQRQIRDAAPSIDEKRLATFIRFKKRGAAVLTLLLLGMACFSFYCWCVDIVLYDPESRPYIQDVNQIFFVDFFTVLALFDVLVLLFSIRLTNSFIDVFRNAGFFISTVVILISFSAPPLFNIPLLIIAVLFGVLILRLTLFVRAQQEAVASDESRREDSG